jgi:hypothetical protein
MSERKRTGRPPLGPELKLTSRVAVFFTQEEYALVRDVAQAEGRTEANLLRHLAQQTLSRYRIASSAKAPETERIRVAQSLYRVHPVEHLRH